MTPADLYLYRVTDVLRVVDGDTIDLRISAGFGVRTYKTSQGTVGIGDGAFGRWAGDVLDVASDGTATSLGDALVAAGLAERSQG